jgi:hypothetical protein
MSTMSVRIGYRPLRIGWCVRSDDFEGLRRALRVTHTLWGGRFNPVLPVDDPVAAERLIEQFRLDTLYPASSGPEVTALIDRLPHLRWPLHSIHLFAPSLIGHTANLLDITHPILLIEQLQTPSELTAEWAPTLLHWDENDPLADVLLTTYGDLPSAPEIGVDYRKLLLTRLGVSPADVAADQPLPRVVGSFPSLSDLTTYGLERDRVTRHSQTGIYMGDCRQFADLVNFWNLRATDRVVYFYDPRHSARLAPLRDAHLGALNLAPELRRPWQYQAKPRSVTVWCRDCCDAEAIPSSVLPVTPVPVRDDFLCSTWPEPPTARFEERFVLGALDAVGKRPALTLQLPDLPFDVQAQAEYQHAVVSLTILGDLPEETGYTFWTPHLHQLQDYYGRECYFLSRAVRSQPGGLDIVSDIRRDALTLYALPRRQLIASVFDAFGIKATPSRAGLLADRLIRQMGGPLWCKLFVVAGVRKLLQTYGPDQSFNKKQADTAIGGSAFGRYAKRFRGSGQANAYTPQDALRDLARRGMLRAGLELECPECHLTYWLLIDALRTEVSCEYCGHEFNVTPALTGLEWKYRRSGLFGHKEEAIGGIAVSLVLRQLLLAQHGQKLVYDASLGLEGNGACIPTCETDFAVLQGTFDAGLDLIIGECKTKGEIRQGDIDNLLAVAGVFKGSPIRVFVVFAKLAPFVSGEIDRLRAAKETQYPDIILLSDRELEADLVYEWTHRELKQDIPGAGLDDLVRGTAAIHFDRREPQA